MAQAKKQLKVKSNKKRSERRFDKRWLVILVLILTTLAGAGGTLHGELKEPVVVVEEAEPIIIDQSTQIELGDEPAEVVIENEAGENEVVELPVVEQADSNINFGSDEKIDGGKGEYFPTATPQEFSNAVKGKCIDQDGYYGSQCWDLSDALFFNLVGRHLSTCGTGAAKGIMNCKEQNAGEDFEIITDKTKLQAGDIAVFDGGRYGHTGMVMGEPVGDYVALLSANQGGGYCDGGGASVNVVAYSTKNFTGAFRYKQWIKVEPPKTGMEVK